MARFALRLGQGLDAREDPDGGLACFHHDSSGYTLTWEATFVVTETQWAIEPGTFDSSGPTSAGPLIGWFRLYESVEQRSYRTTGRFDCRRTPCMFG